VSLCRGVRRGGHIDRRTEPLWGPGQPVHARGCRSCSGSFSQKPSRGGPSRRARSEAVRGPNYRVACDNGPFRELPWNIRYTAGHNQYGWASKCVADKAPAQWTLVTIDLFKDFGERTLTGIALTVFGGRAAYFDHIYLGRTVEDLDRIDVTGLRKGKPPALAAADLARLWAELADDDAAKVYRAFWTLVAAPEQAAPFLGRKLAPRKAAVGVKELRQWIRELDDRRFKVREAASARLAENLQVAAVLLEQELERGPKSVRKE
jgi:hypothetical protein